MSLKNIVVLGFASVLVLSGCTAKKDKIDPLTVDRPAEDIFKEATDADKNGEFSKAITLFSEVERQHPYSELATQAQIRQAEVAYDNLKYDDAILSLDRFIELHPGHPNVDYAYYLKALCFYEQMTDVRRDQAMTEEALIAFDTLISRFPESKYAREAMLKRDLTIDHLAGKEMDIGRYYQKKEQYNAAINRFTNVVKNYQTTTHVPEALHRLVETYTILGLTDEALQVAAVLGHNYPGSQWYVDSYALMDPAQKEKLTDTRSWVDRTISGMLKPD
jgi:outer membrane protein assembly factor BamD